MRELGRERMLEREDGRATGRRAPGWKGEPEVVSQPAFKSSPLGLTEPMKIHSQSLSVPLPTLSLGPSSWKCFWIFLRDLRWWKKVEAKRQWSWRTNRGRQLWFLQKTWERMFIWPGTCCCPVHHANEDEQHTSCVYVHPRAEEDKSDSLRFKNLKK